MKQVPETTDVFLHTMKMKTDHLEYVGDDAQYVVFAGIPNGAYTSERGQFEVRLNEDNAAPKALVHGGMIAWTNLEPEILRRAMLLGINWMARTGQLTPEMFVEGGLDG